MRKTAQIIIPIALLMLTACSIFEKAAPDQNRYMVEARRDTREDTTSSLMLDVRPFNVALAYGANAFVYKKGEGEVMGDYYHGFFVSPGEQVAEACRNWLSRAGLFGLVSGGGTVVEPTHRLEGDLVEIYGDYSTENPRARLTLRIALLDGEGEKVLFQREYEQDVAMKGPEPRDLVAAWNEGLRATLTTIEADLRGVLAGGTR